MPDPWRKRKQRKRLTGPPAFPGRATPSRGQRFFTRHETRITAFPVARTVPVGTEALQSFFSAPAGIASGEKSCFSGLVMSDPWRNRMQDSPARRCFLLEQPQAAANGFSRITRHETRITAFMLFTRHETRLFRITAFTDLRFTVVRDGRRHRKPPSGPLPPSASRCFPVRHCSRLFAIVRQKYCPAPVPSRRPVAAFLRVVARHGAAMARHGRPPPPRAGNTVCKVFTNHETRLLCFSRDKNHETWFLPVAAAAPRRANQARPTGFSRITSHESRLLYFSSHDFPRFPGISRYYSAPPSPRSRCPHAVSRNSRRLRAASAAANSE